MTLVGCGVFEMAGGGASGFFEVVDCLKAAVPGAGNILLVCGCGISVIYVDGGIDKR